MGSATVRMATAADAPVLAYQRRAMFEAEGLSSGNERGAELEAAIRRWIEQAMPAGTFYSWLAEVDGEIVSGGGLQIRDLMPRPGFVRGEPEVIVLSMWTEPAHRRRGYARQILEEMLGWCRVRGIRRLTLHASPDGRPLYTQFGFKQTNEMRLEFAQ